MDNYKIKKIFSKLNDAFLKYRFFSFLMCVSLFELNLALNNVIYKWFEIGKLFARYSFNDLMEFIRSIYIEMLVYVEMMRLNKWLYVTKCKKITDTYSMWLRLCKRHSINACKKQLNIKAHYKFANFFIILVKLRLLMHNHYWNGASHMVELQKYWKQ